MKKNIKVLAFTALLAMPASLMAAEDSWYNPKSWFNKGNTKNVSTTVTGNVDSIKDQVFFKTLDGQVLVLLGNKASKVAECGTSAKIRVFGNVYKPSDKYPAGALQVRNYKVLESSESTENSTVDTNTTTPEPYEEPTLENAPELKEETTNEITATSEKNETVIEEVVEEVNEKVEEASKSLKTYVVQSGDTLGKISSKVFGTTTKWKQIAEANGITNPKHLKVGMTLNVPEN